MTTSRHPRRCTAPATLPRLRPLAWAVAVLMGPAWGAAPGLQEIPVKSDVWHKPSPGRDSQYLVNQGANSVTATVRQFNKRAIYNWKSFNIGANATVNFDMQGGAGSSALNRIHDQNPSQIFGKLNANGEVLLINRNGIIFGKGAQINVQGLIASTLDINDDVFMGGFTTIDTVSPTFEWKDAEGVATYAPEDNFVRVEAGASITTASGGRVFLMAPKVENAGEITTPGGQTVLAGGEKVWLKASTTEPIYASEANSAVPATRGLLVEVSGAGSATNLGKILAQRGNITLVGYAVRNAGKLLATTSATAAGSVFLQARRVIEPIPSEAIVRANEGGKLTLDSHTVVVNNQSVVQTSLIEITPDNSETSDGNATFTRSRVQLSGQTITLGQDTTIVAHGGIVDARAEDIPSYTIASKAFNGESNFMDAGAPVSDKARITVGKGVVIDVSGTRATPGSADNRVSVARNFVTTEVLTQQDLKDSPLQKFGALYPNGKAEVKVTFDVRESAAVIGGYTKGDETSSYVKGISKTAGERLADGGSVTLASTGGVFTHQSSQVNVSGGNVVYESAVVKPTQLLGADGKVYTANTATKDVLITKVLTKADTDLTRYGVVTAPGTSLQGRLEAGYVEGRAGGTFGIYAPTVVALGQVKASTEAGERQIRGFDPLAKSAAIKIGSVLSMNASASNAFVRGLTVTKEALLDQKTKSEKSPKDLSELVENQDKFWSNPTEKVMPGGNRVSAASLNASGAGVIELASNGHITVEDGADLQLVNNGQLTMRSRAVNGEGVTLGGSIAGHGANVHISNVATASGELGDITLKAGRTINVAGNFVNRQRDGADQQAAWAGGNVTLASVRGLDVQDGSSIDVSGGATASSSGAVIGTRAGAITLESQNNSIGGFGSVHVGGTLRGQQMANTTKALNDGGRSESDSGKLRIKAGDIRVVAADGGPTIRDGIEGDGLSINTDLFSQGGFKSFDLEGVRNLHVAGDVVIDPQVKQWIPKASMGWAATGSQMDTVATSVVGSQGQRPAVNLNLTSKGFQENGAAFIADNGSLRLDAGSQIRLSPKSVVSLTGGNELIVNGAVEAAGGKINLDMVAGAASASLAAKYPGRYQVGGTAILDVSGTRLVKPSGNGLLQGEVLSGGSINLGLSQGQGSVVTVSKGAQLKANGVVGQLDVSMPSANGGIVTKRQAVASDGGSISVAAGVGGAVLAGDLQAKAGNDQAMGGSLSVVSTGTVRLQQGVVDEKMAPDTGVITVAADMVESGGFADVKLKADDRIELKGAVDLAMRRNLMLDAPVLVAKGVAQSLLKAGSVLSWTNTFGGVPLAGEGTGASVKLQGGLLDLSGRVATDGVSHLNLVGDQEVRLRTSKVGAHGLSTAADVVIQSPQLVGGTGVNYTLDASGHALTIEGGNALAALPLSAGSNLTFKAATIDQKGTIQAPFGQITLSATERVTLHDGSVTSVSGDGLVVPYGTTTGGQKTWTVNGQAIERLPEKTITVEAPGQTVELKTGSTLDLSAGGQVVGWEFVVGPTGSKDVFTGTFDSTSTFAVVPSVKGYAPIDAQLLADTASIGDLASVNVARQITFGTGGPVPAGTYTVLPARYALLPGAFLIRPSSKANLAMGQSVTQPIGSALVGAKLSTLGVSGSAAFPTTYEVLPQAVAKLSSEIRETQADAFFSTKAAALDQAAPRGTAQGGSVNLVARRLSLEGRTLFKAGGELNIASEKIRVVADSVTANAASAKDPDSTFLSASQLNAMGVASLMLGGVRQGQIASVASGDASGGARQALVTAAEVTIDQGVTLKSGGDIIIAAMGKVQVSDGARVEAIGTSSAEAIGFSGDGALVRVSADSTARSARVNASRETGEVVVGESAVLKGGALTVEATQRTQVAGTATLAADNVVIGAARIALGDSAPATGAAAIGETLVLSPGLANQLMQTKELTLRSFDGIDFSGQTNLGGATQKQLTLDAAALRVKNGTSGQPTVAQVTAGSIVWTNTTGLSEAAVGAAAEGSRLTLTATGAGGADGHVRLGAGNLAMSGAESNQINAAGSIIVQSVRRPVLDTEGKVLFTEAVPTQVSSTGGLTLRAQSVTTRTGDNGQFSAQNNLLITRPTEATGTAVAVAGAGGRLTLRGASIEQAGTVALSSGALRMQALGQDGQNAITFAAGSITDLSGRSKAMDGAVIATPGGALTAIADKGSINLSAGSTVDVSAGVGAPGVSAGSITLQAVNGSVMADGAIKALAGVGQTGGSLSIDSLNAVDLTKLANSIAAQNTAQQRNVSQALSVRQRGGDMTLGSGVTLGSESIKLVSDAGHLTINGTLDASGAKAGKVELSAKGNVIVTGIEGFDALINASATGAGADGGKISINSDGGSIGLRDHATVRLNGSDGGRGGQLNLRAVRTAQSEVPIEAFASDIVGADRIVVEGVKVYQQSTIDSAFIDRVKSDNDSFIGATGQNSAKIADRLTKVDAQLAGKVVVRSGVEVRSTGDMTVATDWNLLSFDTKGDVKPMGNGQPMNLTLRAGGNLKVQSSVSDGFRSAGTTAAAASKIAPLGFITDGEGADLTFVAGADLSSSDAMAIEPTGSGSVQIGRVNGDVVVRTTTGNIRIAASQDIQLTNDAAVVYTTGRLASSEEVGDVVGPSRIGQLNNSYFLLSGTGTLAKRQSLYLTQAGDVELTAGGNVESLAEGKAQYGTEWWWRAGGGFNSSEPFDLTWYSRYDQFRQGLASFGGGDVSVHALGSVRNIGVSSASNGYVSGTTGIATVFNGGNVKVRASDDIQGVFIHAGGPALTLEAGRDIKMSSTRAAPQIHYQDTASKVWARQQLTLGAITEVGTVNGIKQGTRFVPAFQIIGLAPNASLSVLSSGSDIALSGAIPEVSQLLNNDTQLPRANASIANVAHLFPTQTTVAAPEGALLVDVLGQASLKGGELNLLARDDLQVNDLGVKAIQNASSVIGVAGKLAKGSKKPGNLDLAPALYGSTGVEGAPSVRLVSEQGSVSFGVEGDGEANNVASPVRIIAAKDITTGGLNLQHQEAKDLSLIQAGRDINIEGGLKVQGQGDAMLAAGRHVNVNAAAGITAVGRRFNFLLGEGSASLTVLAGVDLASGKNYVGAAQDHFELLGLQGQGLLSGSAEERRSQALALAEQKGLDGEALKVFMQQRLGLDQLPSLSDALLAFDGLPIEHKALLINQKLTTEVIAAGVAAGLSTSSEAKALAYQPAYDAIEAVFPGSSESPKTANVAMGASLIKTYQNSPITVMAPSGGLDVGQLVGSDASGAASLGIVTTSGGSITTLARNNIDINQSRISTVGEGDLLLWSSNGDIDAGRGAKTLTSKEDPVFSIDGQGNLVVDLPGSASGSGINLGGKKSKLYLYAPKGKIDAGDAGIKSAGASFFGAQFILGGANIETNGPSIGIPPPPPVGNAATNVGSLGQSATAAGTDAGENSTSKRRSRRQVLLELLGFGGELPDPAADCRDGVTQKGDCADSVK